MTREHRGLPCVVTTPAERTGRIDSYFVCATPRTGSSLLLGLLESTGVAGRPQAYFRAPDEALWAGRWGLRRTRDYAGFVRAAIAHGRTGNGVFGAKLMWDTFQELLAKLDAVSPGPLARMFGETRFVYVRRDDVVAQAVSWLRAEQTGAWYAGGNGEISGTAPTGRVPEYDRDRIAELVRTIGEHNAGWEAWFASAGVEPYRVRYEQLADDPVATTRDILGFLGLSLPEGSDITPRHRRQADDLNHRWVSRYLSSGTT